MNYECIRYNVPFEQVRNALSVETTSEGNSVIERLFGTTNTEFVFNLLGNIQASKTARLNTRAVNPKQQAWRRPRTISSHYQKHTRKQCERCSGPPIRGETR